MTQSPKVTILLMLSLVILAAADRANTEPQTPNEIVWIDVRSQLENQLDSIQGDPNIPHRKIVDGVTERFPDKNTPIRLYCAKGGRAGKALNQLIERGYSDVQNVGGIAEVREQRFSTAEPSEAPLSANEGMTETVCESPNSETKRC